MFVDFVKYSLLIDLYNSLSSLYQQRALSIQHSVYYTLALMINLLFRRCQSETNQFNKNNCRWCFGAPWKLLSQIMALLWMINAASEGRPISHKSTKMEFHSHIAQNSNWINVFTDPVNSPGHHHPPILSHNGGLEDNSSESFFPPSSLDRHPSPWDAQTQ